MKHLLNTLFILSEDIYLTLGRKKCRDLFLCRCFAGSDGRLRTAPDRVRPLHAQRKVFSPDLRQ